MCSALLAAANEPYTIYPVPHKQVMNPGTASFSQEVFILAEPGIDEATINRAKQVLSEHGLTPVLKIGPNTPSNKRSIVLLGVNGSNKMFDGWITQLKIDKSIFNLPKYDRHIISLISDDDDTVLAILDKRKNAVQAEIYTKNITPQLSIDIEKHNAQYRPITVTLFDKTHDRFLCIDNTVYHIGASLKDLGKKWFAFSMMEITTGELILNVSK